MLLMLLYFLKMLKNFKEKLKKIQDLSLRERLWNLNIYQLARIYIFIICVPIN